MQFDPVEYIYSFSLFGRKGGYKPGLERIGFMLNEAGNPQQSFETIHIGGTNGKGSTAAFLDSILQQAGYKTARFTSPHLQHYGERMMVNNSPLDDEQLGRLVTDLKPIIEKVDKETDYGPPSFFEVTTFIAFCYFEQAGIDIAVVEVGLGGRFDATNILEPRLTAITNIGLDHTRFLGDTEEKIALEKSGIIKNNTTIISSADSPGREVIKGKASEKNAPFVDLSKKYDWEQQKQNLQGQKFNLHGPLRNYLGLCIPLLGKHQMNNAVLAVALAEHFGVAEDYIRQGLSRTYWPGRLEVAARNPLVILDGAHNPSGFKTLTNFLREEFTERKIVFILSFIKDKEVKPFLKCLEGLTETVIFSTVNNFRAADPWILRDLAGDFDANIQVIPQLRAAIQKAKTFAGPEGIVCLAGSLYAVGEGREILRPKEWAIKA